MGTQSGPVLSGSVDAQREADGARFISDGVAVKQGASISKRSETPQEVRAGGGSDNGNSSFIAPDSSLPVPANTFAAWAAEHKNGDFSLHDFPVLALIPALLGSISDRLLPDSCTSWSEFSLLP